MMCRVRSFGHLVLCIVASWHVETVASLVKPGLPCNSSLPGAKEIMMGIGYAPVPIKEEGQRFPNDDFMSPSFAALWDMAGRGDLNIMKRLGANTVRLYGNDPRFDHKQFLQAADAHGLRVIAGMSNYPFTAAPNACSKTGWDCYEQLKKQYADNLKRGFLQEDGSYHAALSHVSIINEPDYKAPGLNAPKLFCKAIISALDGMLSAEKEANVRGNLVTFTATFSYGICRACSRYNNNPALGQMYELKAAMLHPSTVGYSPKNDLRDAYENRFHHSFNAASPATSIRDQFLNIYSAEFREPFFIGEYHAHMVAQRDDLAAILNLAKDTKNKFLGICFFEFQKSYWKGGSELDFGMLGLGTTPLVNFTANDKTYTAWCLDDHVVDPHQQGTTLVQEVIRAYGGEGYDFAGACISDPARVPITANGYKLILAEKSTAQMMTFVARVVGHLGGVVVDKSGLKDFAAGYSGEARPTAGNFAAMVGLLAGAPQPKWARWDTVSAACVADHGALPQALTEAVDYACRQMQTFKCADVPQKCKGMLHADYVFSVYYNDVAGGTDPLRNCFFTGAAQYAPHETYKSWDSSCVVTRDPASTALTQEGYAAVLKTGDSDKVAKLIRRVLSERLHENVSDTSALKRLARNESATLPRSFGQLLLVLRKALWTCGGETNRKCPRDPPDAPQASAWTWFCLATAVGIVITVLLYFVWERRQRQTPGRVPLVPDGRQNLQQL